MAEIQPYQFEPLRKVHKKKKKNHKKNEKSNEIQSDNSESEWEDMEDWQDVPPTGPSCCDEDLEANILKRDRTKCDASEWCKCQNCLIMPVNRECLCCREIDEVSRKIEKSSSDSGTKINTKKDITKRQNQLFAFLDILCITEHPNFNAVCLNKDVLWASLASLHDREGVWLPDTEEEVTNKTYRFAAYRQFTYFIYCKLGRHVRRIIPACAVSLIRGTFPEPNGIYVNFEGDDDGADAFSEIITAWEYIDFEHPSFHQ